MYDGTFEAKKDQPKLHIRTLVLTYAPYTYDLMSTGPREQRDVSPCRNRRHKDS